MAARFSQAEPSPPPSHYAYAPAVFQQGKARHVWFCQNDPAGAVRDHIFYLPCTNRGNGSPKIALTPGASGAWDSFHVCDPSVVQGRFRFGKEQYRFAMFYLGNDVDACRNNQVGLALARKPEGPWVRCPEPILKYRQQGTWGVGQPSALNVDGRAEVLLFYTRGETGTGACVGKINLAGAEPKIAPEQILSGSGLTDENGNPDYLNNFDVMLDAIAQRIYAVRERHPYPETGPSMVTRSVEVVSIPLKNLLSGGGTWQTEAVITPELTGHPRNHNACFLRDPFGRTLGREITIFFSTGYESVFFPDQLWSYELWEIRGKPSTLPTRSPRLLFRRGF